MRKNPKNGYSLFFSKIKQPSQPNNDSYWKAKSIEKIQVQVAQGCFKR